MTMDTKNSIDAVCEPIAGCRHCGRCVLCGPPCCAGMAADIKAYQQSPEFQAELKQRREKELTRKRATKLAKRARRVARLAAKTWDGYDQFLADQSAWEGFATRES